MASRNLALFGLVALVLISFNLVSCWDFLKNNVSLLRREIRDRYRLYLAGLLLLLVAGGILYLFLDARKYNNFIKTSLGWGLVSGSEDSVRFFQENKLSGPIFNNYDLGSALIFWLYPQEKVFVDNRPEAYSTEFFQDVYRPMQVDREKWLAYSEKYKFKTVYFSHTDSTPWGRAFLGQTIDSNWALVYFDRYTVIFLNKQEYDSDLIEKLALSNQALRERLRALVTTASLKNKFQLASLATLLKQTDIAEEIYREIIFSNPDNGLALSSLASLYASSSDRNTLLKSLSYFQAGLKAGYRLPGVYNQMGLVNWSLSDYKKAEAAWRSALKLERRNASALYYLEQVRQLKLQGQIN
jgi:tetratricopeptide (TPR) repeat protein